MDEPVQQNAPDVIGGLGIPNRMDNQNINNQGAPNHNNN